MKILRAGAMAFLAVFCISPAFAEEDNLYYKDDTIEMRGSFRDGVQTDRFKSNNPNVRQAIPEDGSETFTDQQGYTVHRQVLSSPDGSEAYIRTGTGVVPVPTDGSVEYRRDSRGNQRFQRKEPTTQRRSRPDGWQNRRSRRR